MATIEERRDAAAARAAAAADKAAELAKKVAALEKQVDNKKKLLEKRADLAELKKWGRRPRETHQKILVGVAALSMLRDLTGAEKTRFQKLLLSHLEQKDRAPLLNMAEFTMDDVQPEDRLDLKNLGGDVELPMGVQLSDAEIKTAMASFPNIEN
jgi:hypothetical protein